LLHAHLARVPSALGLFLAVLIGGRVPAPGNGDYSNRKQIGALNTESILDIRQRLAKRLDCERGTLTYFESRNL
jgi:hypothetical protein